MSRDRRLRRSQKSAVELGLMAVVSTQLWHHQFIDGSLADLASHTSTYPLRVSSD